MNYLLYNHSKLVNPLEINRVFENKIVYINFNLN